MCQVGLEMIVQDPAPLENTAIIVLSLVNALMEKCADLMMENVGVLQAGWDLDAPKV